MALDKMLLEHREEILRAASEHGARNVRIFGSRARGEGGPDSDVDVLIRLNPGQSLLDLIGLKHALEDLLGLKVDVVTEDGISPYLRARVMQEAVPL
jgi:predicted nucleotidyltransferase